MLQPRNALKSQLFAFKNRAGVSGEAPHRPHANITHLAQMPLGLQAKKVAATEQSSPLVKQPSLQHSSSSDGVSTSSTSGSLLKQSSQSKLSACRAPAAKLKPRTLLYVIFAVVSLNQLLSTVVHARH
jgi:hypothetical protein